MKSIEDHAVPTIRSRHGWVALLATMMLSACAAEVAEGPGQELDPDALVEPVQEALSNPLKQYAVRTESSTPALGTDHIPSSDFRLNVSKVVRAGTGEYLVHLSDAAFPGSVMVVAYGGGIVRCKFAGFAGAAGGNAGILVRCHNGFSGDLANSRFVMTAVAAGSGITGRVAGGLINANGSVAGAFNTRGGVAASRAAAGDYRVFLFGLGAQQRGGTVQITALGSDASHCKVVGWSPDPAVDALTITVNCFAGVSNNLGDSAFSFLYDEQIPALHNRGAYAWASNATSASYQTPTFYTFSRGPGLSDSSTSATASLMKNSDGSEDTGHYKMVHHGPSEPNAKKSFVFVGAYGAGAEYCKIVSWGTVPGCTASCDIEVQTQCFRQGMVRNTRYVQTWGSFSGLLVQ
jgi:hypothetical protein